MFLFKAINNAESDYYKKVLSGYETFQHRYGFEITDIDNVINCMLFREGLHSGCVMTMKRLLKRENGYPH